MSDRRGLPPRRRWPTAAAALALATLVVAGCSGSDGGPEDTAPTVVDGTIVIPPRLTDRYADDAPDRYGRIAEHGQAEEIGGLEVVVGDLRYEPEGGAGPEIRFSISATNPDPVGEGTSHPLPVPSAELRCMDSGPIGHAGFDTGSTPFTGTVEVGQTRGAEMVVWVPDDCAGAGYLLVEWEGGTIGGETPPLALAYPVDASMLVGRR